MISSSMTSPPPSWILPKGFRRHLESCLRDLDAILNPLFFMLIHGAIPLFPMETPYTTVSGYARGVKNGFVTFSLNWKDSRQSYEMVERNTDCEQSLIFLKDSEVTCILWAWRSRETRDSCLTSLPLHALGVGQRQDTLLLMRYKRFNGYLDYLNTFIYI